MSSLNNWDWIPSLCSYYTLTRVQSSIKGCVTLKRLITDKPAKRAGQYFECFDFTTPAEFALQTQKSDFPKLWKFTNLLMNQEKSWILQRSAPFVWKHSILNPNFCQHHVIISTILSVSMIGWLLAVVPAPNADQGKDIND